MARTEKTEITIETDEVVIIRRRRFVTRWCDACGHDTDFAPLEPEISSLQTSLDRTSRQDLHVKDPDSGTPMVCMQSLLKATQSVLKK